MAKKTTTRQLIMRLITKFLAYQVEKQVGKGVISDLTDFLGEDAQELLASQLGWSQEKIIEAFEQADQQFIKLSKSNTLKQAVQSQPLARIPSLEKFANALPQTLDDKGLLELIKQRFRDDWPNLTKAQIENAAHLYRKCLDNSLASRADQLPETAFRILQRIDTK